MPCRLNANQVRLYNAGAPKRMSRSQLQAGREDVWGRVWSTSMKWTGAGSARPEPDAKKGVDNAADCDRRTLPSLRSSKATASQKVEAAQFLRENQS
jgi:hypothetical protein